MSIETRAAEYGSVLGGWEIKGRIGGGSQGKSVVFEIERDNKGWCEHNALKVISLIEERGDQSDLPAFRRNEYTTTVQQLRDKAELEVQLMEQLHGKTNIVSYLDHKLVDWTDDTGFGVDLLIRMEKLTDLRSQLTKGIIYKENEIIKIARDICQALVICHKKNIIHRDIKPENIFFNEDGDYKLGDFGVSRIMSDSPTAMASTGIGTIAYSAPEQFSGAYDKRVDIYSLGLVLYELTNGNKLPFAHSSYITQEEIQIRLAGTPLPEPGNFTSTDQYGTLPATSRLTPIILKACAFKPENRYASAIEMLRDLNKIGGNHEYHALTITRQPSNKTTAAGRRATFMVAAEGDDLVYQWQCSAAGTNIWVDIEDSNSDVLVVDGAASKNGCSYRCKIVDTWGQTVFSESASLVVEKEKSKLPLAIAAVVLIAAIIIGFAFFGSSSDDEADETEATSEAAYAGPVITKQPTSKTATLGSDILFTVEANGQELTYQWEYCKEASQDEWHAALADGNQTSTMTVHCDAHKNGLQYRCIIRDNQGNEVISEPVSLTVIKPEISLQPANQNGTLNGVVEFLVEATGNGLKYQWEYLHDPLKNEWRNAQAQGNQTPVLTVDATQDRNGLQYRCVVTDENGNTVISNPATLTVVAPQIKKQPTNQNVTEGSDATFSVEATGNGLKYQWQYRRESASANWENAQIKGNQSATMVVPGTQDRNGLQYRCVITDEKGNQIISQVVTLTVKKK